MGGPRFAEEHTTLLFQDGTPVSSTGLENSHANRALIFYATVSGRPLSFAPSFSRNGAALVAHSAGFW